MNQIEQQIENVVDSILQDYQGGRDIDRMEAFRQPDKPTSSSILHCRDLNVNSILTLSKTKQKQLTLAISWCLFCSLPLKSDFQFY